MIVSESELLAAVARDRADGKRVGVLPARFDLVRVDLVRAMTAAASSADRLAVLVVDDGGGPITVQDRAELVDGLRGVDYVCVCQAADLDRLVATIERHAS